MSTSATAGRCRIRARVTGTVQGVGFRPYVYRLAGDLELGGHVLNDERGVVLEVEGTAEAVDEFLTRLPYEAPPLASVQEVTTHRTDPHGDGSFTILESELAGPPAALVSPDVAICDDCLHELFDPADRRYRYPFINCTNCGPRFTIVRGVPYDRRFTTMAGFEMCQRCQSEYDDPRDRRFHAQPNACPVCGPSLTLVGGEGADPLAVVVEALCTGAIVAVKGVGGFHLACLARDEAAVATLRSRKHRDEKPFALMARDIEDARKLVHLCAADEALLVSRARPIVLVHRRMEAPVARAVAPRSPDLGVMLPYSPLHHLLLADVGEPLVMTSGNISDEPIAYRDDDALERLAGIADLLLLHDRPIETRTDDSVVRACTPRPLMLRRSRGYVPESLPLPIAAPRDVLACGAELKNTFCLAKSERAWVGPHIGDLENWETLRSFRDGIEHMMRLFAVDPQLVAHDLHPDYLSTRHAQELAGVELVPVQHHHAHLAACLAEQGETGPAIGAIYDGTGYGEDGTVWGGELLFGDLTAFERVGHLLPVRMPGGEAAIREPWRMACAWLIEAYADDEPAMPLTLLDLVSRDRWTAVSGLIRAKTAAPVTTSMGRLFDAVAALVGVRAEVSYEGQAAVELEALADRHERQAYPASFNDDLGVLDVRETLRALMRDLSADESPAVIAARFHNTLAHITAQACQAVAECHAADTVVLSGGVFQNRRLIETTLGLLKSAGLRVLLPERLPPNDGGISYGQAAIAAARSAEGR